MAYSSRSLFSTALSAVAFVLLSPLYFIVRVIDMAWPAVSRAFAIAFPKRVDPWDRPVDVGAIVRLDRDKPRVAFHERARLHRSFVNGGFLLDGRSAPSLT